MEPLSTAECGQDLKNRSQRCGLDNLEATKNVTDALKIPIALGEQEYSDWRFQYTIRNRGRNHGAIGVCTKRDAS